MRASKLFETCEKEGIIIIIIAQTKIVLKLKLLFSTFEIISINLEAASSKNGIAFIVILITTESYNNQNLC